jgi:hypothetical protein
MKTYKILTGVMAAAVLGGASAMAQFNYQNGDMLAAFGNGGTTDVIVDLGSIAQFQTGSGGATLTYTLTTVLNSTFGGTTGVYWSLLGANDQTAGTYNSSVTQADPFTVWATDKSSIVPHVVGSSLTQSSGVGDISTMATYTSPNLASAGQIVDYAPGIELVNSTIAFSSMMTPYNGTLNGDLTWNALQTGPGNTTLYQSDPGNHYSNLATPLGVASLSSGGVLTFAPTPEPSTWAMLGSGLMALLALRRRK